MSAAPHRPAGIHDQIWKNIKPETERNAVAARKIPRAHTASVRFLSDFIVPYLVGKIQVLL